MDVSSDSQKDGFKIAMAHFVVPKLGFRNFYGGVALWCPRLSLSLSLSAQDCSFFLLFPAGSVAAVSVFGVLLDGLSNVQKFLFSWEKQVSFTAICEGFALLKPGRFIDWEALSKQASKQANPNDDDACYVHAFIFIPRLASPCLALSLFSLKTRYQVTVVSWELFFFTVVRGDALVILQPSIFL